VLFFPSFFLSLQVSTKVSAEGRGGGETPAYSFFPFFLFFFSSFFLASPLKERILVQGRVILMGDAPVSFFFSPFLYSSVVDFFSPNSVRRGHRNEAATLPSWIVTPIFSSLLLFLLPSSVEALSSFRPGKRNARRFSAFSFFSLPPLLSPVAANR